MPAKRNAAARRGQPMKKRLQRCLDEFESLAEKMGRTDILTPGVPLAGVAHRVGHKHLTTTALYVATGEAAAKEALAVMARFGGEFGGERRRRGRGRSKNRGAKGGT